MDLPAKMILRPPPDVAEPGRVTLAVTTNDDAPSSRIVTARVCSSAVSRIGSPGPVNHGSPEAAPCTRPVKVVPERMTSLSRPPSSCCVIAKSAMPAGLNWSDSVFCPLGPVSIAKKEKYVAGRTTGLLPLINVNNRSTEFPPCARTGSRVK